MVNFLAELLYSLNADSGQFYIQSITDKAGKIKYIEVPKSPSICYIQYHALNSDTDFFFPFHILYIQNISF